MSYNEYLDKVLGDGKQSASNANEKGTPLEVEFTECPIPADCIRRMDEVRVKRDGCIWQINKNDADPFPSNPHAHNVESGLKMDLSNGNLFLRSKPTGKAISHKNLLFVREQVVFKGVKLPSLSI